MANKKLSILTLPEGTGSTTYDIDALYLGGKDASQYMLKTSGEWNQEVNFGSSGLLLIGRFPMYDSGVVVEINATTNTTYHGTLVLATQNIKNTQEGSYKAVVYGDADNTITPSLYIERLSGSNVFSIYFKPASWSKNVVHIQAVSLNTTAAYGAVAPATDICKSIDTLPATATIRPTNALLSNFYTESEVNNLIAPAMIMRGTLGTGGTITVLPTASQTTLGDMYKVITAGTYATIAAKVNDTFVCYTTDNSTYNWMLIPSGDDVEDTWRQIQLNGTEILGIGSGTKPLNIIPGSNMTITNSNGSVTFGAADTTYSFTGGTNCFTVTPSEGSAQTVGVTSDRLFRLDTRSLNPAPYATDNYPGYTTVHLKYNNIVGISNEGTYSALMQIYPWADSSGGAAHQLVYGSNGGIYHRYGTSTWSPWSQLATREWVEDRGYIDDIGDCVIGPSSATNNAIALYDGTTGKKIKNSGATIDTNRNLKFNGPGNISWEDGSYYQRIQVTDDSNTETAVFTFQQTENSGTVWNDLFTIQDRGTIIAKNPTGGALSLTLDRGSNANWRWLSDNGNFIAQCDYTSSKGSYFNVLTMNYNTGHVSVDKGSLTSAQGFIHGGLTAASGKTKNDYVLLAGGGSKALSDMAYSLPLATSTVRGGLKVGYSSTQDNLALTLSTAAASAEQAYVSLPSRLYGGNTTNTTNPVYSGYYFYKDESDAGKVFHDTAGNRQAATWVSAYDSSWAGQIGVGYYKDVIAYRRKQSSTTWGSWIELADKQWVKDQSYLTSIPSRLGPNTNGNTKSPDSNHTSGWAYYSGTAGTNGLPANVSDAEYLTLGYNDSTWAHQLLFKFNGGGVTGTAYDGKDLYTRIYNQTAGKWSDWYTILTSGNAASILDDKYVSKVTSTDNAIVRFDGTGGAVQNSNVTIDDNNNVSVPGSLTVSGGAQISGRSIGSGDDEGLIISRASNGYAGVILGGAAGKRSVFYLMPDTYTALPTKAVWRYNDGTNQSEIAHPGKTGTIALLSDLGPGGDYDLSAYLPLAGGTMKADAVITLPNTAKIVHHTNATSNYVADAVWYKGSSATGSGYDAQIGWHNTGDTNGAITILPYATDKTPWSGDVGLYISKTKLKYNGTNVSLEGHGHTNMVTGSGLTADKIVVGNGSSTVKTSSKGIATTLTSTDDNNVPTSKAVAAYVAEQKTSSVYWADQSVATSSNINTEPTFKSIKISDGSTLVKARWTYSSTSDCVELVWE